MKFNLPINVQSEVKQYDPEVRAMVELQKELEAAKKAPSKPRKPREYRRGNPAQLVPHELFHDDPMEGLHLYQQAVKDISDDTDVRAGHAIVRRLINNDNELFGIMYYFRYLWVAAWIPEVEEDGTRPYVYGISVAFKDNATIRSTVPPSFFARNCTERKTTAPIEYMFNQDDMISYTVGRTKYKTKTIIITEDEIKDGYRDEFWMVPSQLHKWNFNTYSSRTRDLCHVLRRFSERVGETVKREEQDNNRNIFDRIYQGDPTLAKCVAGGYSPVAFLNRRNIDCYRNEVDWYIKQILDVTYVGDMGEPKEKFTAFLNNKVMRRYLTEICTKVENMYRVECAKRVANFYRFRSLFEPFDYMKHNALELIKIYPDIPVDYLINHMDMLTNARSVMDNYNNAKAATYLRENVPVATFIKLLNDEYTEYVEVEKNSTSYHRHKDYNGRYVLQMVNDTVGMIHGLIDAGHEVTKPRRWRFREWHDHIQGLQWKVHNKKEDLPQCLFPEPMKVDDYTFMQPLHTHMLAEWGKAVRNCVGSHGYADRIKDYQSMILLVMVNRESRYTIQCEVQGGEMTVSQIADVCNKSLSIDDRTEVERKLGEAITKREQMLKDDQIEEQRRKLESML